MARARAAPGRRDSIAFTGEHSHRLVGPQNSHHVLLLLDCLRRYDLYLLGLLQALPQIKRRT